MQVKLLLVSVFFALSVPAVTAQYDSLQRLSESYRKSGNKKAQADIEYKWGIECYNRYEDSLAVVHLKRSLDLFRSVSDIRRESLALNRLGNVVAEMGRHEEALRYYQDAVKLARKMKNDTLLGTFRNNVGLEYKSLGRYREAVDEYYATLKLKEKIGAGNKALSATLLNLGVVWDLLGDQKNARMYYQRSLALKKELGDSLGISRLLSNISVIEKNSGDWKQAVKTIQESNRWNSTVKDYSQYYVNYSNLANINKNNSDWEQAFRYFDSAFYYARELNNSEYLSDLYQNLGSLHFDRGNYAEAIRFLSKALDFPGEEMTDVLRHEIHGNLAEAYSRDGQYKLALMHLQLSNTYRDRIFKVENQKAIQEAREKYETEHKEKELALQRLALAESEADARRKTTWLVGVTAFALIVGLLILLRFRKYREREQRRAMMDARRLENYRQEIEILRANVQAQLGEQSAEVQTSIGKEEINQYLIDPLSDRELEVLREMASGKSNREIAECIFVSENTVKFHLKNIYLKLDARNRTEAITKADALGVWKRFS